MGVEKFGAVKVSRVMYEELRDASVINSRSMIGQAEHWLRLGQAFESDPAFSYEAVTRALKRLDATQKTRQARINGPAHDA